MLVHGWDLAVATGQGYALDPELMQACRQIIEPQLDAFRSAGALGPEVAVPADASAQTRFLAMLGRTGLSAHSTPATHAELGNLRAITRSSRPVSQQYGIGRESVDSATGAASLILT